MTETKLKPCPFCGKVPSGIRFVGNPINKWYVECTNEKCRIQPATSYHKMKGVVVREWNKRAKEDDS